jgi:hypothetical protein
MRTCQNVLTKNAGTTKKQIFTSDARNIVLRYSSATNIKEVIMEQESMEIELLFCTQKSDFTNDTWKELMMKANQLGLDNKQINEVKIKAKFGEGIRISVDITKRFRIK